MKHNFFWRQREWAYKAVKPRIIAEEYMEDDTAKMLGSQGLTDYKFFCFAGIPRFVYVSCGLENHSTAQISFLDMEWKFTDFRRSDYRPLSCIPPKPTQFSKMKEIASQLSRVGEAFVRVDLYEVNGKIFFSEMTFYPCSGFMPLTPEQYDKKLGEFISTENV
mgnify:CR=1 FL=1